MLIKKHALIHVFMHQILIKYPQPGLTVLSFENTLAILPLTEILEDYPSLASKTFFVCLFVLRTHFQQRSGGEWIGYEVRLERRFWQTNLGSIQLPEYTYLLYFVLAVKSHESELKASFNPATWAFSILGRGLWELHVNTVTRPTSGRRTGPPKAQRRPRWG